MPLSLKIVSSTLLIGGGAGGIPWLLSTKNGVNKEPEKTITESQETQTSVANGTQPETIKLENSGNCTIVKKIQEIEDILWTLRSINPDSYVKVDCDNTDKSTDSPFTANWAGLFPNVLFTNLNSLTMGKKIEIKENTESLEESKNYRTTFSGANFYSPVIGEWPWQQTWEGVDSRMVEVKIVSPTTSSDPIYVWIGKIDLTPRGEESLGELI